MTPSTSAVVAKTMLIPSLYHFHALFDGGGKVIEILVGERYVGELGVP
jgi:hypothetical protein